MKRCLVIVLTMSMLFSFVACGKTEAVTEINSAAAKGTITATGAKKIKQALGL